MAGSAGVADPHQCASSVRHQTSAAQTEGFCPRMRWILNALAGPPCEVWRWPSLARPRIAVLIGVRLGGGSYDMEPRSCPGVGASGEGWKDLCLRGEDHGSCPAVRWRPWWT